MLPLFYMISSFYYGLYCPTSIQPQKESQVLYSDAWTAHSLTTQQELTIKTDASTTQHQLA